MSQTQTTMPARKYVFLPFWAAIVVTTVLVVTGVFQGVPWDRFFKEQGPVENASVAILVIGAVGFLLLSNRALLLRSWEVPVIFLLLAAREMDYDKRFLDKGILQARLYTGDYPLDQKLIGAVCLLLILYTVYRLVRNGTPPLLSSLKHNALWAWCTVLALVVLVLAKSIDGAGRKLEPYGITLTRETEFTLSVLEEVGEMGFGLLLVFAVCAWFHRAGSDRGRA